MIKNKFYNDMFTFRSFFAWVLRNINVINPTSHGRHFISDLAARMKLVPNSGVFKLQECVIMDLNMEDYIDRNIYFDSFEFLCKKEFFKKFKSGCVFVDIGTNIGYYSLVASCLVGRSGRVISFEPNPSTLNVLKRNIELSSSSNIELFEFALSDSKGEVQIFCPINETHGFSSMKNQGWEKVNTFTVLTEQLDVLIPKDINRIDFLKIDVEGAELQVFKGARETIMKFRPTILLELNENAAKYYNYDTLDVIKLVLSYNANYKMKYITEHRVISVTYETLLSKSLRNGCVLLY